MEDKTKRPKVVLIAQIVLLIPALLNIFSSFISSLRIGSDFESGRWLYPLVSFLFSMGISSICLAAVIGMANRRNYGRWLAVVTFGTSSIASAVSIVWTLISPALAQGKFLTLNQLVVILAAEFLLFATLTLRLAFAENVSRYFSETGDS